MGRHNYTPFAGYQTNELGSVGVSATTKMPPDYAVSATNLDFENAGFQLGARYTFGEAMNQKGFTMGLSYSKYFLFDRKVANTA